jgi:molybdenum cofactor cytidylyltransferase
MEVPKMLLPFGNMTIIEKVIDNVRKSGINNIIVVLGADRNKILNTVGLEHVIHCFNDNYKEGMLSSVQCGFKLLPIDFKAVMIFPGDMPLIPPEIVKKILNSYYQTRKGLVVPVYRGKRGHPLLIDNKYKDEIDKIDPEEGLRSLAGKFLNDLLEVDTDEKGIIHDIDTRDDYLNAIKQNH